MKTNYKPVIKRIKLRPKP